MAPLQTTVNTSQVNQQPITAVRLTVANDATQAFVNIEMPNAFLTPATANEAMNQLRAAIMEATTIINNPNAVTTCGCGASFSV